MANRLFDKARQAFLEGQIHWLTDNFRIILIDTGAYIVDTATHDFLNDVALAARVATSDPLTGKTSTDGIADANDANFPQGYPMPAPTAEAALVVQDTGADATTRLVAWIDNATGLPMTLNGADFTAVLNDGPDKLFKL